MPRLLRARRGLTVLEVVVALAVLALVAGMVSAALSNLLATRDRGAYRLAAAEAAHRIILQYNDNTESVIGVDAPIEVSGFVFGFEASESVIDIDDFSQTARITPTRRSRSDLGVTEVIQQRLWRVEVDILSTGDGPLPPGDRVVSMNRTFDLLLREDIDEIVIRLFQEQLDQR